LEVRIINTATHLLHPSFLGAHNVLPHHPWLVARAIAIVGWTRLLLLPVFLRELLRLGIFHQGVLLELLRRNLDPSHVLLKHSRVSTLIVLILVE